MVAIITLVKYRGRLDSKISFRLSACYQYYNTERLESSSVALGSSVQTEHLVFLGVCTAHQLFGNPTYKLNNA